MYTIIYMRRVENNQNKHSLMLIYTDNKNKCFGFSSEYPMKQTCMFKEQ